MKEKLVEILADLLDDHNMVLYALILLALYDQTEIKTVIAGMLGYWAKSNAMKGEAK